jgi:pyruvate dehydrogenase E1 component alpha subunit
MAAIWKLPVIFVCENNLYASTTPASYSLAGGTVAGRACAYGIPGQEANGNDILEVRRIVTEAVERARSGKGPSIVENRTYRYRGHFEGDPQRYRMPEEVEAFKNREDPVRLFSERLKKERTLSERAEKEMIAGVARRIDEAVRYAREAPLPAPEAALEDLFVSGRMG